MGPIDRHSSLLAILQESFARNTRRVFAHCSGQSTVEYALVGALVVIAAAGALTVLGGELNTVFTHISDTLRTPH